MHDLSEQINDFDSLDKLSRHRSCFIRTWLNQFERNKLEYYSVLFGIFGLSFVVLSLCILITILSINRNQIIQQIDCTIINITYTHVKLCESYRCQVFNYCIPYICIIVFVSYYHENKLYESQLYSMNHYSKFSCSYEPCSCVSSSRIHLEQKLFLENHAFANHTQCCLHLTANQPIICPIYLNSLQYTLGIISIIICFFIGFIGILIGLLIQCHLNNYFKIQDRQADNFFDTILNYPSSHDNQQSSFEKITPVNYDILTQTISQHNTPLINRTNPNRNLLLFDKSV